MISKFGPLLAALTTFGNSDFPDVDVRDARVLPDIQRHLTLADQSFKNGDWNTARAYSESMLLLGDVRYQVSYEGANERSRSQGERALKEAMAMWEAASEYQVTFTEVSTNPTVLIRFAPEVESRGRDVGGHVQWRRGIKKNEVGEIVAHAEFEIWIRTVQPNGKPMRLDHMRHVAAHELGHVLGMNDSSREGDIMGPLNLGRPAQKLQREEVESLQRMRQRALNVRRASLITAIYELEGYNLQRASR